MHGLQRLDQIANEPHRVVVVGVKPQPGDVLLARGPPAQQHGLPPARRGTHERERAPAAGVILDRKVMLGQMVGPQLPNPLFTIASDLGAVAGGPRRSPTPGQILRRARIQRACVAQWMPSNFPRPNPPTSSRT